MSSPDTKTTVKLVCPRCGGQPRNHQVIAEHVDDWTDEDAGYSGRSTYQICQCLGCETFRFRHTSQCDQDPDGGVTVRAYPEVRTARYRAKPNHRFPDDVQRMYVETIQAMNADAAVLAGGGLRAIVEAICKHQAVAGKNLQEKIDKLVEAGLLASNQAELLHEERYIGNAALHELEPPSQKELELGLQIIEGLLNTIYVLPAVAKELKKKRMAKKTTPPKKT